MHKRILVFSLLILWLTAVSLASAQNREILLLEIEGPVTPVMADYFERGIREAENRGAEAVVIQLDTPGGSVGITQEIVQIFRAADVPVIIFVAPRGAQAASAGAIITIAAHAAGMAPETVVGAASPVGQDGAELDETIFRKITEDMKASIRSLAERRGEEVVELAEAMIDDARAVHAQEALEIGFIDAVAEDVPDLLQQLDGLTVIVNDQPVILQTADATTIDYSMNAIETTLHLLVNPLLVGILLAIGVQAIIIEISNPGGWVAGFIGAVCLALALYGLGQLPANWFGLGLIFLAFVLFLLEVKAPVHGALALVGIITMVAGFLVLFNSNNSPEFARISIWGALAITLPTALLFTFIVYMAARAQMQKPATGQESMIGQRGPVRKTLVQQPGNEAYSGMVFVEGELWKAEADEAFYDGEEVEVTAVNGFTLTVKRTSE
ncbi:MAG: nodulation protein NfeD [Aquificales bacterium]|nr:nodulation protein NfeD [Aquificales bacterium]